MPMAISMVGASVIWRLQYAPKTSAANKRARQTRVDCARQAEQRRTRRQHLPGVEPLAPALVLAALLVRLGFRIYGSWQRSEGFAGATVALIVVGWLFVEFLTRSMGGFTVLEDGSIQPQTVAFREGRGRSTTST